MWCRTGTRRRIAWRIAIRSAFRRHCRCITAPRNGSYRRGGPKPRPRRTKGRCAMGGSFLKRLLLMLPTLIGVLTLTFVVIQFVPGGPVEQAVHDLRRGQSEG